MISVSTEIKSLIDKHLRRVQRSGPNNIMAVCPFHKKSDGSVEKTPSFAMSLVTGLWFCHSCQSAGNLYTFLKNLGNSRTQVELYRGLIDAAAKNAPAPIPAIKEKVGFTAGFSNEPLPESLLGMFDNYPKIMLDAGFTTDTLDHFDVGFDIQHVRATFPLRNIDGTLVGISGRAVDERWPRYKVYNDEYKSWGLEPRGELNKSDILWNGHAIYPQLYFNNNPDKIIVVEGFKACMWLWQSGIKNVVALLGNYLSKEHQRIFERLGSEVCLFLDNNEAGQAGTIRAIERLKRTMSRVRVVEYPDRLSSEDKAQPDSLTVDEVISQVANAKTYGEWLRV